MHYSLPTAHCSLYTVPRLRCRLHSSTAEQSPMPEEKKPAPSPLASAFAPAKDTQRDASLDAQIDAMLAGRHADPFALLGPHPVSTPAGQRWVIRFFRPGAADALVLLHGVSEPVHANRLRPEGFFEATLPDTYRDKPDPSAYRIRYRSGYGETAEALDTYCLSLSAQRVRSSSHGRRPPLRHLRKTRRASQNSRRRTWCPFRSLGAQRPARQYRRRFQPLGWPCRSHARPRFFRHLGDFSFPNSQKAPSTNTKSSVHTATCSP